MFPNHLSSEICEVLGLNRDTLNSRIYRLRKQGYVLEKSKEFWETKGKRFSKDWNGNEKTRFKKGQIPHNKGKKGIMKANKASFRKGHHPVNSVPVGTIAQTRRVAKKCKPIYLKIKIAEPNKWELLHRWIWIQNFGEIPEGYMIKFKNFLF